MRGNILAPHDLRHPDVRHTWERVPSFVYDEEAPAPVHVDEEQMPYRSRETLEKWVTEFADLGYPMEATLRVIEQDGEAGENTGLVALHLADATTSVFIQPIRIGSAKWTVTFEARDEPIELTAPQVSNLSAQLSVVSSLCAFLEAKASVVLEEQE